LNQSIKFLIVAGEASGDRHAAFLIAELKKYHSTAEFYGIGGDEMMEQGVDLFFHIKDMALLGLFEIIRHLPFIHRVFRQIKNWLEKERPTAVILVDYPGFNLKLARVAHDMHIPVIYYICPQLWAWGQKRVEKIRKYIDLPLVIFHFEKEFYNKFQIDVKFVGHPLMDQIQVRLSDKTFREKYDLALDKPIVALLPGSRLNEVKKILPIMIETARKMKNHLDLQWVVGKSPNISKEIYQKLTKNVDFIKVLDDGTYPLMKYAKLALVASGTATLETGYLETPMIVLYKISPITYFIGRFMIKIKRIALVNIVMGKKVVPELIQKQANPENVQKEMDKYLTDKNYYAAVLKELKNIPRILGIPGTAERAAREIINYLKFNL
jgi:lipid-A-disaccharide synthase